MASLKKLTLSSGGKISEVLNLPPSAIDIDPRFNVREDGPDLVAHIRMLADSIRDDGFMRTQPLTVRQAGDRIVIVDGHCRFAAARLAMAEGAEIATLPCLTDVRTGNEAERTLQLITANAGRPLAPLEQAKVVMRLHSYGWDDKVIAKKIGRTPGYVAGLLELAAAPVDVHRAVVNGFSASEATKVIRKHGDGASGVIRAATEHARREGRDRAKPRDVAAVTKPRTEPVSLCSLAVAAVLAWDAGYVKEHAEAMDALRLHLGPLAKAA
jgi:ParB/RepB/Spo0J family partition protein